MDQNELEELARNIGKIVAENRKFLDKVMDEDFESEEEIEEDTTDNFEEL
jgi:Sec-independent protein translocase protein TatA